MKNSNGPRYVPAPMQGQSTIGRDTSRNLSGRDRNAIADTIRMDITRGRLAFGQRIPEGDYAQAFGVSRTPVREAIMMLASLDLVTIRPKYGTFVTSFTRRRLRDVFDARYLIESGGVALCSKYQLIKLNAALDVKLGEMRQAELARDHDMNHDLDTAFHRLLVEAPGNEQLLRMFRPVEVCVMAARCQFQRADWVWTTAASQHEAIVEALRKNDLEAFRLALREHLTWSRDALLDVPNLFTES